MITPIESLAGISPAKQTEAVSGSLLDSAAGSLFGSIFQSVLQNVTDTNREMVESQYLLSTGQLDNPSALMIAMTKYSTATELLVQMRSKVLDAYSELTRMSI